MLFFLRFSYSKYLTSAILRLLYMKSTFIRIEQKIKNKNWVSGVVLMLRIAVSVPQNFS